MTLSRTFLSGFLLSLMLLAALSVAPQAQAQTVGDIVTCPESSSVYYLADDGSRWVFPNEKTYFTWFNDFDHVQDYPCEELAVFPIGEVVTYNPGTRLVKIQTVPNVFAVEPGGVLRHIQSEEQAQELYGDDWNQNIDDVSDAFWPSYTEGEPLEAGEYADGSVAGLPDDDDLFYVEDGVGYTIPGDVIDPIIRNKFIIESEALYNLLTLGDVLTDDQLTIIKNIARAPDSSIQAEEEEVAPPDSLEAPVVSTSDNQVISTEDFTLSWPAIENTLSYEVEVSTSTSFTVLEDAYLVDGAEAEVTTSLTTDITGVYYYRVRATHGDVESDWSNTVSITVDPVYHIQNVPDEHQPPNNSLGFTDTSNWSAGLSVGNALYYHDVIRVRQKALDVTAEVSVRKIADYIGWFVDTNNEGSTARGNDGDLGAWSSDLYDGVDEFIRWGGTSSDEFETPGTLGTKKGYDNWIVNAYDSETEENEAWQVLIDEIVADRPPIVVFDYWNPIDTFEDYQNDAYFYNWGSEIASSDQAEGVLDPPEETWNSGVTGHAVTAVGIIGEYDIGDGNGPQDWLIVHDNWSDTAKNIAVPFENWDLILTMQPN